MDSFMIRRGDRLPALTAILEDSAGAPINLTGWTVRLNMSAVGSTHRTIDNATVSVTNATGGAVSYAWGASDTASTGLFNLEFEGTNGSGLERTFPAPDFVLISVLSALD